MAGGGSGTLAGGGGASGATATEAGAGTVGGGLGVAAGVTIGAVILILLVGLALNKQLRDVIDGTPDEPPGPEPANVFIGPASTGACMDGVMLEHGLSWTDQGWRAPLSLPEPLLFGEDGAGGDRQLYDQRLAEWLSNIDDRVTAGLADARTSCDRLVTSGT